MASTRRSVIVKTLARIRVQWNRDRPCLFRVRKQLPWRPNNRIWLFGSKAVFTLTNWKPRQKSCRGHSCSRGFVTQLQLELVVNAALRDEICDKRFSCDFLKQKWGKNDFFFYRYHGHCVAEVWHFNSLWVKSKRINNQNQRPRKEWKSSKGKNKNKDSTGSRNIPRARTNKLRGKRGKIPRARKWIENIKAGIERFAQ